MPVLLLLLHLMTGMLSFRKWTFMRGPETQVVARLLFSQQSIFPSPSPALTVHYLQLLPAHPYPSPVSDPRSLPTPQPGQGSIPGAEWPPLWQRAEEGGGRPLPQLCSVTGQSPSTYSSPSFSLNLGISQKYK